MKSTYFPLIMIVFTLFSVNACKSQDSVKYIYGDGSNNTYVIKKKSLEYKPIKPIESSSGEYSGGQPKTIVLSQTDYDKIVAVLTKAIEDKSMHIDQRIMMSGLIVVETKGQSKSYILGARSTSKADVEALLKELMEKK
jgi:hypothetical protein